MLKKMIFRGTVMIGSLVATISLLDQLEKTNNKRKEAKIKKENSNKNEVNEELTEEEVEKAMNNVYREII